MYHLHDGFRNKLHAEYGSVISYELYVFGGRYDSFLSFGLT